MEKQKIISHSSEETKKIAKKIAKRLNPGDVIGLRGDLGSGKTTFVQGLAEGLGNPVGDVVASPTYAFIHEYSSLHPPLYHMDFYRLSSQGEANTLGLDTYFNKKGISVIEWFERSVKVLPEDFLEVQFNWISETERLLHFFPHGPKSQKILF